MPLGLDRVGAQQRQSANLKPSPRASGGIGRRAGFRFLCPKGRGGSTPPSRTTPELPVRLERTGKHRVDLRPQCNHSATGMGAAGLGWPGVSGNVEQIGVQIGACDLSTGLPATDIGYGTRRPCGPKPARREGRQAAGRPRGARGSCRLPRRLGRLRRPPGESTLARRSGCAGTARGRRALGAILEPQVHGVALLAL